MYEWEKAFNRTILERGRKYADRHCVGELRTDGDTLTAVVLGSERYNVNVRLTNKGTFGGGTCDCPYAQGHHRCKHMAAVLYAAEQTRGELGRAMIKLRALDTSGKRNRFFYELNYLLLDFLPIMDPTDAEKFIFAVLRAAMSRLDAPDPATDDIKFMCADYLRQRANKSLTARKRIRSEMLSVISEAESPEAAGFILRTALSIFPEEKTADDFPDALIHTVPEQLKAADVLEVFRSIYKWQDDGAVKRVYDRLTGYCLEKGAADQLAEDIKKQLSYTSRFSCSLALCLKEITPENDWPGVFDEILSTGDMCPEKIALIAEEKDPERLMDAVDQYDPCGYIFKRFEKELKKVLPGRALVHRVRLAEKALSAAKTRDDYRNAVMILKKASAYRDGKDMVAAAAKYWRENYPKKYALLEELDRAGL